MCWLLLLSERISKGGLGVAKRGLPIKSNALSHESLAILVPIETRIQ